jgi:hypothetical protein
MARVIWYRIVPDIDSVIEIGIIDVMAGVNQKPDTVRTDLEAHDHAMSIPISQVVSELADLLGATTVAVIGGVQETRAVHQWTTGREPQRPNVLRFALQLATMVSTLANREIAKAWFHGSNPRLNDQIPMLLLRDPEISASMRAELLDAARAFGTRS